MRSRTIAVNAGPRSSRLYHLAELDLHPEGPPCGLVLAQAHRRSGAVQHGHPREPGQGLLEELELLARISGVSCWLRPVTLPPGRARLATSPASTGSVALTMTIGIVVVAARPRARAPGRRRRSRPPCCRTRSAAISAKRSGAAFGPAVLDDDVLALDVTQPFQAVGEHATMCAAATGVVVIKTRRGQSSVASGRPATGASTATPVNPLMNASRSIIGSPPVSLEPFEAVIRSPGPPAAGARRDRQAERLGGLEVDHQLERGGLLDREVAGFVPLKMRST